MKFVHKTRSEIYCWPAWHLFRFKDFKFETTDLNTIEYLKNHPWFKNWTIVIEEEKIEKKSNPSETDDLTEKTDKNDKDDKKTVIDNSGFVASFENMSLDELRNEYKAKFWKEVTNKKNDKEWLLSQLIK